MPDPNHAASPFQLLLTPERAALAADGANTLRVLVRVQAPARPADPTAQSARRDPLHLALVLDRSGSMAGAPLQEAKHCACHIVDQLGADDRAAIVAFDSEVELLAPLTAGSQKAALRAAIDGIGEAGCTDLHGGWRAGADELAGKLAAAGIHRVVLLSDGCANEGETALEVISGQCRDLARAGVSTSTYGLGNEFNEDLMLAMARAGRGNAYYGDTAADLAEPFAAEFALLTNLCARGLVLKVNAPDVVGVRLRNDYEAVAEGARAWKLPDLAYAAEAWAVAEFELPGMGDDRGAGCGESGRVDRRSAGRGRRGSPDRCGGGRRRWIRPERRRRHGRTRDAPDHSLAGSRGPRQRAGVPDGRAAAAAGGVRRRIGGDPGRRDGRAPRGGARRRGDARRTSRRHRRRQLGTRAAAAGGRAGALRRA